MSNRDERGYDDPINPEYGVTRSQQGTDTCIDIDEDGMQVSIEQGFGYMRESCSTFIHMDVLIRMLESQGYTVRKEKEEQTG